MGDPLAGHRPDHVGSGEEHLRGPADHEDEVGERRGVGRAARARAEHDADLRDHPGGPDVALEDPAVPGERGDALLDAGSGAVVERRPAAPRRRWPGPSPCGSSRRAPRPARRRRPGSRGRRRTPYGRDLPQPMTTPSPCGLRSSRPKPVARCRRSGSISVKVPSSKQQVEPFLGGEFALGVLAAAWHPGRGPGSPLPSADCSPAVARRRSGAGVSAARSSSKVVIARK